MPSYLLGLLKSLKFLSAIGNVTREREMLAETVSLSLREHTVKPLREGFSVRHDEKTASPLWSMTYDESFILQ